MSFRPTSLHSVTLSPTRKNKGGAEDGDGSIEIGGGVQRELW